MRLKGIMPAIATIFDNAGELDLRGERDLVNFCIEQGAHGLTPLVMGGEFYKLADEERKQVLEVVIDEANGRVPVVAGISHSGTEPTIRLGKEAQNLGADALVLLPPYFDRLEASASLREHFAKKYLPAWEGTSSPPRRRFSAPRP